MAKILIKNGRVWDGFRFSNADKAGNHIESDMGYRCVLTVSDGIVVYRH